MALSSYSAAAQLAMMAAFTSARIWSGVLSFHWVEAPAEATVVSTASGLLRMPVVP